jgi:hypothetical protein
MDEQQREARLEEFIQPVIERWRDPALTASLSDFAGFCELLGLSNLQSYLHSRRVNEIEDWAATPLDEEGKALKLAIEAAQNASDQVDHPRTYLLTGTACTFACCKGLSWGQC